MNLIPYNIFFGYIVSVFWVKKYGDPQTKHLPFYYQVVTKRRVYMYSIRKKSDN